jgi:hypothetical protein
MTMRKITQSRILSAGNIQRANFPSESLFRELSGTEITFCSHDQQLGRAQSDPTLKIVNIGPAYQLFIGTLLRFRTLSTRHRCLSPQHGDNSPSTAVGPAELPASVGPHSFANAHDNLSAALENDPKQAGNKCMRQT